MDLDHPSLMWWNTPVEFAYSESEQLVKIHLIAHLHPQDGGMKWHPDYQGCWNSSIQFGNSWWQHPRSATVNSIRIIIIWQQSPFKIITKSAEVQPCTSTDFVKILLKFKFRQTCPIPLLITSSNEFWIPNLYWVIPTLLPATKLYKPMITEIVYCPRNNLQMASQYKKIYTTWKFLFLNPYSTLYLYHFYNTLLCTNMFLQELDTVNECKQRWK